MIGDIALLITAIGAIAVVIQLRQNYRQRLRQFESMYIQRYWAITDQLSLDALSKNWRSAKIDNIDEKAIRAYIRLSEDQLQIRAKGWVGDGTYEIWKDGIRDYMKLPMFKAVWELMREDEIFEFKHLSALILSHDKGERYDPCTAPRPHRRLRGLAGPDGV